MSLKRRVYSGEFKMQELQEADVGVPISELTRRYELSGGMIGKWQRQLEKPHQIRFRAKVRVPQIKQRWLKMERLIGRHALEIDFLKNALKHLKGIED